MPCSAPTSVRARRAPSSRCCTAGGSRAGPAATRCSRSGGLGALTDALARQRRAPRVPTIRTAAPGERRFSCASDRAAGVVLASGEAIAAASVISSADPKTTFLELARQRAPRHRLRAPRDASAHPRPRREAAPGARRAAPQFAGARAGGAARAAADRAVARLHRARLQPREVRRMLRRADARDHAADASRIRASRPPGHHVLSAIVQYAPYALAGWLGGRAASPSRRSLIDTLERYAPGLRESIIARRAADAGRTSSASSACSGGHWHHAELALDQFFMVASGAGRGAVPHAARRAVPVRRGLPSGRRRHGPRRAQRRARAVCARPPDDAHRERSRTSASRC